MKVKVSQIPENDGKPKYQKKKENSNYNSKSFDKENYNEEDEEDEKETKFVTPFIFFEDFDITMSLFDIKTIETDVRFIEKPRARWQYGITINKGLDKSIYCPVIDKSIWFEKEDTRDRRYKKIMEKIEEIGFKVIRF